MADRNHDALERYLRSLGDRREAHALRRDMAEDPALAEEIEGWRRLADAVKDDAGRIQAAATLPPIAGLVEATKAAAAGGAGGALTGGAGTFGPIVAAAVVIGALAVAIVAPRLAERAADRTPSATEVETFPPERSGARPIPIERADESSLAADRPDGRRSSDDPALEGRTALETPRDATEAARRTIAASASDPGSGREIASAAGSASEATAVSTAGSTAGSPPVEPTIGPRESGGGPSPQPTTPTAPAFPSPAPSDPPSIPGPSETPIPPLPDPPTTVPAPTTVPPPTRVPPPASGIAGTIVRRDGRASDGLEITLWAHRDGASETRSFATTLDARGAYTMPLGEGVWWVRVDPNDARPAWAGDGGGGLSPIGRSPILVRTDGITPGVDILLDNPPGGLASGSVLRADGVPAGHVLVSARRIGAGLWHSALTGADGFFELPLEPGTYELGIADSLAGPPTWWLDAGGMLGDTATPLSLGALDGLTLTLP